MNCSKCGFSVPTTAAFCTSCGTAVGTNFGYLGETQVANPGSEISNFESQIPAPFPPQTSGAAPAQKMCTQHPATIALQSCSACGAGVCSVCDFVIPAPTTESLLNLNKDTHLCPTCMSARNAGAATQASPVAIGVMCSRHPQVQAIRWCGVCSSPMCATCDFEMPGHLHICPGCAANPSKELSSGRKKKLIISYALAAWSSLALAGFMAIAAMGFFEELYYDKNTERVVDLLFNVTILFPSIGGTALGFSAVDRKLFNPGMIWGAVIWNCIVLALVFLLILLGTLAG
jgi:hypothetical protein